MESEGGDKKICEELKEVAKKERGSGSDKLLKGNGNWDCNEVRSKDNGNDAKDKERYYGMYYESDNGNQCEKLKGVDNVIIYVENNVKGSYKSEDFTKWGNDEGDRCGIKSEGVSDKDNNVFMTGHREQLIRLWLKTPMP